jgi:hypothetical protein
VSSRQITHLIDSHGLQREPFTTSRLAEFCSEKELVNQTGHAKAVWPLVILKELVDNAVDACEEAGVAPVIAVKVAETLTEAYKLFTRSARIEQVVNDAIDAMYDEDVATPSDLIEQVRAHLAEHPADTWDEAIAQIVEGCATGGTGNG